MRRAIATVSLLGVAFLFGSAAERGPIAILSDAQFTPENGVVGGTGTAADPYLIVGWEIRVPSGTLYGIRIENTTAAFVVRGCRVSGAMDGRGAAIYLHDVVGGVIEDCAVTDSINGIVIETSRGSRFGTTSSASAGWGSRCWGSRRSTTATRSSPRTR